MPAPLHLAGQKYGDLTVLRRIGGGNRGTKWLCLCACGKETTAYTRDLQHDGRVSCGCRQKTSTFGHDLWPAEKDAQLRAHWATGLSSARIGAAMGITKNSVIGRAHRLELEGRASPIKRNGPAAPKAPRAPKVTLPKMASEMPVKIASEVSMRSAPIVRAPFIPRIVSNRDSCCWPEGEGRSLRFCDSPDVVPGKPYCAVHTARAYTRTPEVNMFVPMASGARA